MKKLTLTLALTTLTMALTAPAAPAAACPLWECQYDINDYNCGCAGSCGGYQTSSSYYCESSVRQPIYCQYCGHETWDCVCYGYDSYDYSYDCDYDYDCGYSDYDYGYSCSSGYQMTHWANIRDEYGNIIGQAGCGDSIEVCGVESDTGRILIYDYSTGCYGSVLAECVYGGYQWDGTGDNGYYNSYQGYQGYQDRDYGYQDRGYTDYGYTDCGYQDSVYSGGGSCAYSNQGYVTYCETIIQRCVTYSFGGARGCGYGCY